MDLIFIYITGHNECSFLYSSKVINKLVIQRSCRSGMQDFLSTDFNLVFRCEASVKAAHYSCLSLCL